MRLTMPRCSKTVVQPTQVTRSSPSIDTKASAGVTAASSHLRQCLGAPFDDPVALEECIIRGAPFALRPPVRPLPHHRREFHPVATGRPSPQSRRYGRTGLITRSSRSTHANILKSHGLKEISGVPSDAIRSNHGRPCTFVFHILLELRKRRAAALATSLPTARSSLNLSSRSRD
jgi:hypothetical protein